MLSSNDNAMLNSSLFQLMGSFIFCCIKNFECISKSEYIYIYLECISIWTRVDIEIYCWKTSFKGKASKAKQKAAHIKYLRNILHNWNFLQKNTQMFFRLIALPCLIEKHKNFLGTDFIFIFFFNFTNIWHLLIIQ